MHIFVIIINLKHGLVKSREKLKALYIHNHSASSHQTWQCGDIP